MAFQSRKLTRHIQTSWAYPAHRINLEEYYDLVVMMSAIELFCCIPNRHETNNARNKYPNKNMFDDNRFRIVLANREHIDEGNSKPKHSTSSKLIMG